MTITAAAFLAQRFELPDGGRWSELIRGEVVQSQPPDAPHGNVILHLSKALAACAERNPQRPGATYKWNTAFATEFAGHPIVGLTLRTNGLKLCATALTKGCIRQVLVLALEALHDALPQRRGKPSARIILSHDPLGDNASHDGCRQVKLPTSKFQLILSH
jgi:hypothetical protein